MAPPSFKRRLGPVTAFRFDGTQSADLETILDGHEHKWRADGRTLQIRYGDEWVVPKVGEWIVRSASGEVWTVSDTVFTDAYEPF